MYIILRLHFLSIKDFIDCKVEGLLIVSSEFSVINDKLNDVILVLNVFFIFYICLKIKTMFLALNWVYIKHRK